MLEGIGRWSHYGFSAIDNDVVSIPINKTLNWTALIDSGDAIYNILCLIQFYYLQAKY